MLQPRIQYAFDPQQSLMRRFELGSYCFKTSAYLTAGTANIGPDLIS